MIQNKFFNKNFVRNPILGFLGMAAIALLFGLAATGCDTTTGTAPEEETDVGADYSSGSKKIYVKFEVQNGGWGLSFTRGIVSTQDDTYLVRDEDEWANDFTIGITVPASDEYLNIRWLGTDINSSRTFLRAKMPVGGAGKYTIGLDYNGRGSVATSNLNTVAIDATYSSEDWTNSWNKAIWD